MLRLQECACSNVRSLLFYRLIIEDLERNEGRSNERLNKWKSNELYSVVFLITALSMREFRLAVALQQKGVVLVT